MVSQRAMNEPSTKIEKVAFSQIKISLLRNFLVFFGLNVFSAKKKHFLAERKNGRFFVILARIGSVVNLGHFFYGPDGSTEVR